MVGAILKNMIISVKNKLFLGNQITKISVMVLSVCLVVVTRILGQESIIISYITWTTCLMMILVFVIQ